MARKTFCCGRCGYTTPFSTNMRRHVNREELCPAMDVDHDISKERLLADLEASTRAYEKKHPMCEVHHCTTANIYNAPVTINNNYRIPFNIQSTEQETQYIKNADLKELVSLPLEQSLRRYIQLRNFNSDSPAYKNIMTVLNNRAMTVGEHYEWEADSARRCANVILDCFVNRLIDFATVYPTTSGWHNQVAELADEVFLFPRGINCWSVKDRSKPLQYIMNALYIHSKHEYPGGKRSLPDVGADAHA